MKLLLISKQHKFYIFGKNIFNQNQVPQNENIFFETINNIHFDFTDSAGFVFHDFKFLSRSKYNLYNWFAPCFFSE